MTCKLNLELSSNQMQSTTQVRRSQSHYATKARLGFKHRAFDESNRVDPFPVRQLYLWHMRNTIILGAKLVMMPSAESF